MQGCSVLCPGEAVGEEPVEAEGVDVDGLAHVADPVGAQDVERERAQPGEDAGLAPDAAGVLAQDAVADVVVPVLDAPVRPDGPPEGRRVQPGLAGVEGDLLAPGPQPGAGVLAPGQARDPGRAGDPRPPVRVEAALHREDLDAPVLLAAVPTAVDRLVPVDRVPLGAQRDQGVTQARLVVLHPHQERVAGRGRGGEGFFQNGKARWPFSPERNAVGGSVMAGTAPRARPEREQVLETVHERCPACGRRLRYRYDNRRTVTTLAGLVRLRLRIRRCEDPGCARYRRPCRPEAEGAIVLPQHEFGLDVIALVGALRYREHRSVPEIHRALLERGVAVCERTVTNLLDRYDELVATTLADDDRLRAVLAGQGRAILALDGLQPDVGHEVLWVVRECLSGEVLLARSLLSSTGEDLAALLREVTAAIGVPIAGVVSDGQHSVRLAVGRALPGVPLQLCQFHYLREAALPIFEADRHAKKELKKQVRGVRPIERSVEGRDDPEAEAVRGYCAAVRSALTDDGRPPLAASGLKLAGRLEAVAASLDRAATKGG